MQLLKLLLVFVLLFETISATVSNNDKNTSFSVEKIWQSCQKTDDSCTFNVDDDTWKEDLQEYYNGCRKATRMFHGKAYELADTVMVSFEQYLTKLIHFSNTNTTVLSSSAEAILETMTKCSKLNQSAHNIMIEFQKILPEIVRDFKAVATKLSDHIGSHLSCSFNEALDELAYVLSKFIQEFLLSCRLTRCKTNIDYEPTLKKLQKLMNTVALIAETTLNNSEAKPEVQEAVTILSMLFWYFTIVVQGKNTCHQDILVENKCVIAEIIKSVSMSLDYVLVSVPQAVSAVVSPLNKSIKDFLAKFVNLTMALNTAVKDILGLFDGVAITVADITRNLFKNTKITSAAKGRSNILMGLTSK